MVVAPHKWQVAVNWADVVCPAWVLGLAWVLGPAWVLEAEEEHHWRVCGLLQEGARRRVWHAVQGLQLDVAGAILAHGVLLAARFVPRWGAVRVAAIT